MTGKDMRFLFCPWKSQISYLHYICLYTAINGLLTDTVQNDTNAIETVQNDTNAIDTVQNDTHAIDYKYICDISRREIVNDSYNAMDFPDMDRMKKCQSLIYQDKDAPAPRPCAMHVNITLTLLDLVDIDGIKGSIQMMLKYQEEWKDHRLVLPAQMNPHCVDNSSLKSLMHLTPTATYRKTIWTPDFYMKGMMGIHIAKVGLTAEDLVLRSDHAIESQLTLILSLMCPMHFAKFPFDTHRCNITIESFGKFADDLAILWSERSVHMSKEFTMGGYKISMLTSKAAVVMYTGFPFPRLVMTLIISRMRLRYALLVFVPCTLHFLIAWLAFFLPKEVSQGRSIINCTTSLSLISMLSVYMRYSPQGGHVKAFDVWVMFSIVFQFLCTIDSIIDIRLLYMAFNLRNQREQADTAKVLQLVTDTDNWLGREMRHVEPDIATPATVVRTAVREMRRLSVSLSSTKPLAAASQRRDSQMPGQQYIDAPTRAPSVAKEVSHYGNARYQKFLGLLVRYQEWSQWIYLGAYMFFVWLYWYIYVPSEEHK